MNARVMKKRNQSLQENIEAVEIHLTNIKRIVGNLGSLFPFTAEKIEHITFDEQDRCDALLFRFTHAQDTLADKIFPDFLDAIKEQPVAAVLDRLSLLERLKIIDSSYQWSDLRDLRNNLSHEYASNADLQADLLNQVRDSIPVLVATFDRIKKRLAESD